MVLGEAESGMVTKVSMGVGNAGGFCIMPQFVFEVEK